jgi:hypothetical protein
VLCLHRWPKLSVPAAEADETSAKIGAFETPEGIEHDARTGSAGIRLGGEIGLATLKVARPHPAP